jgi:hypothetical protein
LAALLWAKGGGEGRKENLGQYDRLNVEHWPRQQGLWTGHLLNHESEDGVSHFGCVDCQKGPRMCSLSPHSLKFLCSAYQMYARYWIFKSKVENWICS